MVQGSVCHQSDNSAPSVLFLEKRPLESGNRCISTKLDKSKGICISPFCLVGRFPKKSPERASKPSSCCTSMAVTSMVSMSVADVHKKSDFVAKVAKPFKKSSRGKSLISPSNSLQLWHEQYPGKVACRGNIVRICRAYHSV